MDTLVGEEDVVGQQRTASGKRFVVFKEAYPLYVFKGPFNDEKGKVDAFGVVNRRVSFLKEWNAEHIVLPQASHTFPNTFPGDGIKARSFVFYNILTTFPGSSGNVFTEKFLDKKYGRRVSYTIKSDTSMVKLAKVLPERHEALTYSLLRSYVLLFILKVGDMGLHNTMYYEGNVYIIDYDETKSSDKEFFSFYFSKPASDKYQLKEYFGPFYLKLAEELRSLNTYNDQQVEERRDLAIRLLIEFSPDSKEPKSDSKEPKSDSKEPISDSKEPISDSKEPISDSKEPISDSKEPISDSKLLDERILDLSTLIKTPPEDKGIRGRGRLYYNGLRGGSLTPMGFSPSLMKSKIQKDIRRGRFTQALYGAMELYAFNEVNGNPVVTNLYNRLAVISAEDISPRYIGVASFINEWVVNWVTKDNDKHPVFSPDGSIDKKDITTMAGIILLLVMSPKSRIMSHLWNAYRYEANEWKGRKLAKLKGIDIEDNGPAYFKQEDYELVSSRSMKFLLDSDYNIDLDENGNSRFALTVAAIYDRLCRRDPNSVAWLSYFLHTYSNTHISSRKKKLAPFIIYEMYKEFLPAYIIDPLRDAYFKLSEKRPSIMLPITNILLGPSIDISKLSEYTTFIDSVNSPGVMRKTRSEYYEHRLVVWDYMRDKHTGIVGDTIELNRQFKIHGAHIENQDADATWDLLEQIYNETL